MELQELAIHENVQRSIFHDDDGREIIGMMRWRPYDWMPNAMAIFGRFDTTDDNRQQMYRSALKAMKWLEEERKDIKCASLHDSVIMRNRSGPTLYEMYEDIARNTKETFESISQLVNEEMERYRMKVDSCLSKVGSVPIETIRMELDECADEVIEHTKHMSDIYINCVKKQVYQTFNE